MYCPRCTTQRQIINGRCSFCGYDLVRMPSGIQSPITNNLSYPPSVVAYAKGRGDALNNGRYRLLGQIALPVQQQQYGTAWLAIDAQAASRSRVVIREVSIPYTQNANTQRSTVNEIVQRFVALGQHPDLPKLIDVFSDQEVSYLVFQHIEGETLTSLLRQQGGTLSERTVTDYGYKLCDILSFFSRQQPLFVHGFIHPDTIIIHEERRVSLIHLPLFPIDGMTQSVDKNTSGYFAPEQAHGHADTSSDLYSVAAILYHAVTGYAPTEHVSFFYPPARRLNPTISQEMEAILSRQLRLSTPQRYSSASDMQRDLLALLRSYPEVEEIQFPVLFTDPLHLTPAQGREWSHSTNLLNMGVLAAIMVLLIIGILFAVLR